MKMDENSPKFQNFPVILGFCCVLFFCVGGLVTTMNMTVDIQTKVEMSRDIFLCVIVACVLSLVLGAISKIKRAQSSQKYTVDKLDGIAIKTKTIRKEKCKKNKKPKRENKQFKKKLETKVDIPVSPSKNAVILFDKKSATGGLKKVEKEKWMNCYVPFE